MVEIKFAAVDIGHLRELLAERIQADDAGVDRAQPHRERIDLVLHLRPQGADLLLFGAQRRGRAQQRDARHAALAERESSGKGAREQTQA